MGGGPGRGGPRALVRRQHPAALRAGRRTRSSPTIRSSINFKYFFTRKLMFVQGGATPWRSSRAASARCDEAFEALTLIQTGKAALLPWCLLDAPGGTYWKKVVAYMREEMLIATADLAGGPRALPRHRRHRGGGRGDRALLPRLSLAALSGGQALAAPAARRSPSRCSSEIASQFADVLGEPVEQTAGPVKGEDDELPDLPRLVLRFNRLRIHRLRQLLELINQS